MIRRRFQKLKKLRTTPRAADSGHTEIIGKSEKAPKTEIIGKTEIIDGMTEHGHEQEVDPVTQLQEGQKVRGRHRYELRQPLGAGGFGFVWAADCIEADQDAADIPPDTSAIKFFSVRSDHEGTAFLRRELAALLAMRSRSIPRIYDWTIDDELSFFVMDYYRHGTLNDEFKQGRQFNDKRTWRLLADVLQALQAAHRVGMLHLDIKPANIMRDGVGGYKLIDFGISQATQIIEGPGRTVGAGSLGYQAPEQRRLELHKMDTRTDLWAVGATAWALRTGCDLTLHPEKLNLDVSGEESSLPLLSTECSDVAPELEELIASLTCESQEARPGGAAAVLERLKAATRIVVPDNTSSAQPRPHTDEEVEAVIEGLMDPLWSALCRLPEFRRFFAKFEAGDYLCKESGASHDAFVLLSGKVRIEKEGKTLDVDDREGNFIGEISTLTGTSRAASVVADNTVWTCMFNAAEFERLLAAHPSIGIRLLKLMAERVIRAART